MKERITAILVDDEENSNKVLSSLLNKFCPEIEICGQTTDENQAYELINHILPDLVFLDVQMPLGSGFDLLSRFDEIPFDVIFVTGYDEYAINAIKFSALDYLLKPVEVEQLVNAVQRCVKKQQRKENQHSRISNFLYNLNPHNTEKKIPVHVGEKVIFVTLDSICSIEADSRYSHIQTIGSERYTIARTLKDFEELLMDNSFFLRINRNTIINVVHLKGYSKGEPCMIEMKNNTEFEVSRRKKKEILDKLRAHNYL